MFTTMATVRNIPSISTLFMQRLRTPQNYGIFRVNFDSKGLIPKHRLTIDATYQPDAMCDFYGFNGYQSVYNQDFHKWKKDPNKMNVADYQSRAFYTYKRDLFRFAADVEGTIWKDIKWNAGLGDKKITSGGRCFLCRKQ